MDSGKDVYFGNLGSSQETMEVDRSKGAGMGQVAVAIVMLVLGIVIRESAGAEDRDVPMLGFAIMGLGLVWLVAIIWRNGMSR